MIPVILSGGSGSRLWPLSRSMHPKQFLKLTGERSLFQQTLARFQSPVHKDPVVVCNREHRFIVQEQLDAIGVTSRTLIMEPFGRNTAPAIALTALYLLEQNRDEVMLVQPADHAISDTTLFHHAIEQGLVAAESGDIVLFGIRPDKPETGFGYIKCSFGNTQRRNSPGRQLSVEGFVEKPTVEKARQYVASGDYYWNSGMFMVKASRYLEELNTYAPDIYQTCVLALKSSVHTSDGLYIDPASFEHCPDDSIDYAIMEHTRHACLIPLESDWSDVGSWSALWDLGDKDTDGNVTQGDALLINSRDCYIHGNERLVSLLGVDNLVVIDTKDAVLIAHKDSVQDIKSLVKNLDSRDRTETVNHREVFRPWGAFDSVDTGNRFQVKRITVKPGASLSLQKHHHRAEHWIVVSGTASVTCDEKTFLLSENQSTYIPVGSVHRLANPGKIPLEIIEVQSGSYLGEDDIVRLEDHYGRLGSSAEQVNDRTGKVTLPSRPKILAS
jgi:mannose-1-phosphate guanylyltransferase/mannose-6-phosphate isomerase